MILFLSQNKFRWLVYSKLFKASTVVVIGSLLSKLFETLAFSEALRVIVLTLSNVDVIESKVNRYHDDGGLAVTDLCLG